MTHSDSVILHNFGDKITDRFSQRWKIIAIDESCNIFSKHYCSKTVLLTLGGICEGNSWSQLTFGGSRSSWWKSLSRGLTASRMLWLTENEGCDIPGGHSMWPSNLERAKNQVMASFLHWAAPKNRQLTSHLWESSYLLQPKLLEDQIHTLVFWSQTEWGGSGWHWRWQTRSSLCQRCWTAAAPPFPACWEQTCRWKERRICWAVYSSTNSLFRLSRKGE